jgi:hypothetical protein
MWRFVLRSATQSSEILRSTFGAAETRETHGRQLTNRNTSLPLGSAFIRQGGLSLGEAFRRSEHNACSASCPCARTCCFCGGPPHTSSREEQVSRHASQQNAPAGVHGYLPAQGVWRELDALPYRVGRRRSHSNSAHSSAYHGSDRLGAVP